MSRITTAAHQVDCAFCCAGMVILLLAAESPYLRIKIHRQPVFRQGLHTAARSKITIPAQQNAQSTCLQPETE